MVGNDGTNRSLTLARYVERRNGIPLGARGALTAMLSRSLGASSLAGFWRYWNPIWGYYLGKYVHAPLRRMLPASASVVLTFAVSGAIHDAAATLVRGSITLLFTPWFVVLGLGVVFSSAIGLDLSQRRWRVRAAANLAYLAGSLLIAIGASALLELA